MDEGLTPRKDLLEVPDAAVYLGVNPLTVYRWCREGRLPCVRVGRYWRIRREELEGFLRQSERPVTLAGRLRSFLRVSDSVLVVCRTPELLGRLDAAFFRVGEAAGGLLVRFYGGGTEGSADWLRAELASNGLEASRLEEEGRLRFVTEDDLLDRREDALRRLVEEEVGGGRIVWASFDWSERMGLEAAIRQQEALRNLADVRMAVIKTAVLEDTLDRWAPTMRRRAEAAHSGAIRLSEDGLALSRITPLPPG